MEKLILFGAGNMGIKTYKKYKNDYEIVAVIDNDSSKWGKTFEDNVKIISLDDYVNQYSGIKIWISVANTKEIEKQIILLNSSIDYSISPCNYEDELVSRDSEIEHRKWPYYLKKICDKEGMDVLEIGSRFVTGDNYHRFFEKASYTGFDYYKGENVDVVGDAHELSSYFNKKFDLIFCSAVFEHLAMPWKVSLEIIKLLKPGGLIFIETHYSYSSHERPWHFFQFSENALDALFPSKFGMKCLKKGCSNLLEGKFSAAASDYLQGQTVGGLYCHSEYLGQKVVDVDETELTWDNVKLKDVVGSTEYPKRRISK